MYTCVHRNIHMSHIYTLINMCMHTHTNVPYRETHILTYRYIYQPHIYTYT